MRPELNLIDALFIAVGLLGAACLLFGGLGSAADILERLLEHAGGLRYSTGGLVRRPER